MLAGEGNICSVSFPFANAGSSIALPAGCEATLIKVGALYLMVVINEASWHRIIFGIRKGNGHLTVCISIISALSLRASEILMIFSLVCDKTLLGHNRTKGLSCIRKFSEMPGQWLQFLPGHWTLAGFSVF